MNKTFITHTFKVFFKSVWLFPFLLLCCLVIATVFKLHGSSIGEFYPALGDTQRDPHLLLGTPRAIRSDEWVVNSPLTVAQHTDNYSEVNTDLGNGENMSVIFDVPYKGWSELFRPQNWAFFVMPFENAFAFKWWFLACAVMLSCYFLTLAILPSKRLLAALLSIALFWSAFLQWWYQYITFGPIYYSLFLILIGLYIFRTKQFRRQLLLGLAFAYVATCFALVLYPPFQVPCLIIVALFLLGLAITYKYRLDFKDWARRLAVFVAAGLLAVTFVGAFLLTRSNVISTINNTSYPGQRMVTSGGYSLSQFFSGSIGYQYIRDSNTAPYVNTGRMLNQSEASSFLFVGIFTIVPSLYLYIRKGRKGLESEFLLAHLLVIASVLLLACWLFLPHLTILGKLLFLDKVPLNRAIIGFGLANTLLIVLFIRQLKEAGMPKRIPSAIYCLLVLLFCLWINYTIHRSYPLFLGHFRFILFAIPIPLILYCLLRKSFTLGVVIFALFSAFISCMVNPIYQGTAPLTDSPLVRAIQNTPQAKSGKWITESGILENFPLMAGVPSLSGVYGYPQNNLWSSIDGGKDRSIYNRYAHVNFVLDKNPAEDVPTSLVQPTPDHFGVITEPCGSFLRKQGVLFILTTAHLPDSCLTMMSSFNLYSQDYYIYKIVH